MDNIEAGNIAVLTGLKNTVTGDTLVKDAKSAKEAAQRHSALHHKLGADGEKQFFHHNVCNFS